MTPYSKIYDRFFHRIEEDRDFFNYYELSDDQVMEVAQQRASGYMEEAVSRIILECFPQIDFTDRNPEGDAFSADLTRAEEHLLASLMFEQYLERDISYLKRMCVNYTSKELQVFSPDNWRNSFNALYQSVKQDNDRLMSQYKDKDRLTGQYLSVDFASYDTE